MVVRQLRRKAGNASLSQRIKILLAVRKGGEVGVTDQERWENVISALELCTSEIETRTQVPCEKCHYHNKEYHGVHGNGCCNMRSLQCDILALLKAQEPRVMTATEAYTADYVYIEFDGVITPAIRTTNERDGHRESYFATQQLGGDWMRWDDYGITWRCWTSRPSDEQREATPW